MTKADKSVLDGVVETVTTTGASLTVNNADPKNLIINAIIANQATAEAGTNNSQLMTALGVAQSIAKNSPPTDTSALALALADLQGSRLVMKGGVADPFDDESGVFFGIFGGIDPYVTLAMHFDGANDSTVFIDSSSSSKVMTAVGNAKITTATKKFGDGALISDGNGDRITTPSSEDWDLPGDFTIDAWAYITAVGRENVIICRENSSDGNAYIIGRISGSNADFFIRDNSGNILGRITVPWGGTLNTFHHWEYSRAGSVFRLFRDGVQIGTTTSANVGHTGSGFPLIIGGRNSSNTDSILGGIDELRVSKGIARHIADFTVPTQPYTGLVTPGSINQVYDAALDLYKPSQIFSDEQSSIGIAVGSVNFTYVNESFSVDNNKIVLGIWLYSTTASVGNAKVVLKNSATSFTLLEGTLVNINHTGVGWLFFPFSVGIQIPASGNYYTAMFNSSNPSAGINASRSYYQGAFTSGTQASGWTSNETGYVPSLGVKYEEGNNNMTLVSINYPTSVQPAYARLVLQIDTPLTITANTDLQGQVSRDGGTTWATANLQLSSTLGNIKTYQDDAVDLSGIGAGTNIVWRARTLTNKNIPISGVVTQWR